MHQNNGISDGEVHTWSLEEANEAIPIVTRVFDKIFNLNEEIETLDKDMAILRDIWGARLLEPMNPDHNYYKELRVQRNSLQQLIGQAVAKLQEAGCAVDDTERGVVHFYHKTPRGLAAFCWKYGEQKINHWHSIGRQIKTGFMKRV